MVNLMTYGSNIKGYTLEKVVYTSKPDGPGEYPQTIVWKAVKDGKIFAIKSVDSKRIWKRESKWLNEVRGHPNIVTFEERFSYNGDYILVESFVGDRDLPLYLYEKYNAHSMSLVSFLSYLVDVTKGLEQSHKEGVVHLDLRPVNIRVEDSGSACIIDFGLSQRDGWPVFTSFLSDSVVVYWPPEAIKTFVRAKPAIDLYCLASIIDFTVGSCIKFGKTFTEAYGEGDSSLKDLGKTLNEFLLIAKSEMLDKRPQSAREYQHRIEDLIGGPNIKRLDEHLHELKNGL